MKHSAAVIDLADRLAASMSRDESNERLRDLAGQLVRQIRAEERHVLEAGTVYGIDRPALPAAMEAMGVASVGPRRHHEAHGFCFVCDGACKAIVAVQEPIVAGGQGRDAEEISETGKALAVIACIFLAGVVVVGAGFALAAWLK